jgi:RHS repeat-associated protein
MRGLSPITAVALNGRARRSKDNRATYTGRQWDDEQVLYHFRARLYDAGVGRFFERDPIGYYGSEWNLFEFLDGNLLKYMDALGSQVNSSGLDSVSSYYRECMRKAVRHRSPREFCRCICDLAPPGTVGRSGRNCEQSCIKCMTDITRGPCQCLCEEFTESIRDVGKCN